MKLLSNSLTRHLLLVAALTAVPATLAEEPVDFQVVVHSSNPTESVKEAELSKFFLKRSRTWQHGAAIEPVDQDHESPVRAAFTKTVHGRSVASIQRYWQRQIFSGSALPPRVVDSDQEVLDFVGRTPGAVGYVSFEARLEGDVKVLEIVEPD